MEQYPAKDFKTARDWHVYHVYNDPDFVAAADRLDPKTKSYQSQLAEIGAQYGISAGDVGLFVIRHLLPVNNESSLGSMSYDPETRMFKLSFPIEMTKSELDVHWAAFTAVRTVLGRTPTTRRKPPENTELIYAIFRARRHFTFKEIFALYLNGALPGYDSGSTQFTNEESLERYYRKYAPRPGDR